MVVFIRWCCDRVEFKEEYLWNIIEEKAAVIDRGSDKAMDRSRGRMGVWLVDLSAVSSSVQVKHLGVISMAFCHFNPI